MTPYKIKALKVEGGWFFLVVDEDEDFLVFSDPVMFSILCFVGKIIL